MNKVIGILGGGQLGRMTVQAAERLGYKCHIYTPEQNSPASQVAADTTISGFGDDATLALWAQSVDVITYEFENVTLAAVQQLEQYKPVYPNSEALRICQDRLYEKSFCAELNIPTAPWLPVISGEEATQAAQHFGVPLIMKTARLGYDGKGQMRVDGVDDAPMAFFALNHTDVIAEALVDFDFEMSVIVARGIDKQMACYPPVKNIHRDGILHQTQAPAELPQALAQQAMQIAQTLAEKLDIVGLLAVEMFATKDGRIMVNELAPRPHNSGHWTLDAAMTSQFEQLVRAITGLPLGPADATHQAVMTNLLGDDIHNLTAYQNRADAHIHFYGKTDAQPGRKMGHVTEIIKKYN